MEISDIRVKLMQNAADRLKAVCSLTLSNEFVVRDLKVVEGTNGLFVAMPSRKLSVHCPQCRGKNHLRAKFCNDCGTKLPAARVPSDTVGRMRLHRDIAHPINPEFRELIQSKVIEKYQAEVVLASDPNYEPVDIDKEHVDIDKEYNEEADEPVSRHVPSEYDQLIAGLRGGNHEGSDPEHRPVTRNDRTGSRASDRAPARRNEPKATPAPIQNRAKDSRPRPPRQDQPTRPDNRPKGRGTEPARRPPPAVIRLENDDDESPALPQHSGPPPQKPEHRPAAPPKRMELPKPTPQPPDDSGDAPFGAGIL